MSDLGFAQVIALAFGGSLAVLGFVGLAPVALRWRRRASLPQVYMSDLGKALASTDAFIRPWVPRAAPMPAELPPESVAKPLVASEPVVVQQKASQDIGAEEGVALAAEELKAQLFAIRMTLSDVTAEVQSVREVLNEQGLADEFDDLAIDLPEAA